MSGNSRQGEGVVERGPGGQEGQNRHDAVGGEDDVQAAVADQERERACSVAHMTPMIAAALHGRPTGRSSHGTLKGAG
jgi:hypothetical protein